MTDSIDSVDVRIPITAAGMLELLFDRYPEDQGWIRFENLASTAGYGAELRYSDFATFNQWPSRGQSLHIVEIKVSRQDWLRELKNPAKADAFAKYADFWWLAVPDPKIVASGELPEGWGLYVAEVYRGKVRLKPAVEAAKREAAPLSRGFIAAMAKRVTSQMKDMISTTTHVTKLREAEERGFQKGLQQTGYTQLVDELNTLKATVAAFEKGLGITINSGWRPQDRVEALGRAVGLIMETDNAMAKAGERLQGAIEALQEKVKALRKLKETL